MELSNYEKYPTFNHLDETQGIKKSQEFCELASKRRTIRIYDQKKVPDELIKNAVKAAASAPSGANQQPWFFAVVKDDKLKKEIRIRAEECERDFYTKVADQTFKEALKPFGTDSEKHHLEDASHIIAVFSQSKDVKPDGSVGPIYYGIKSTSIAVGILISALHAAGVGTLTHTPSPMGFLNDILDVPKNYRGQFLVMAGYPRLPVLVPSISKKDYADICKVY